MRHIKINSKQRIFAFCLALEVGMTFLLVTLVLGALGHWDLALTWVVVAILFSILLLKERLLHRTEDSHHRQTFLGFFPLLFYRAGNSLRERAEHELIEREVEDFKPFVFKDHPEDGRYV